MKSTEKPTLQTKRLLLRPIVPTDINNVFKGLSDPKVIRYYGVSFATLEATTEQMAFYAGLEKEGTGMWFAVCSPDNRTFYGAGGLSGLSKEHQKAEIGFWLLPDFWGRGFMTEALPLICNYGFVTMDIHRIEAFVESDNTNCKRAITKLDFQYEGTMKDCEIKNGEFISLDIFAKVKSS